MADTRTITIHIAPEIDDELTVFAQSLGRDKSSIVREALRVWVEDQEDMRRAREVIAHSEPPRSLEEVMKVLGLDD